MKQRIITAIAIILVVALPLIFGSWLLELLALFIVVAGGYEWMHIRKNFTTWPKYVMPISILFVLLSRFIPEGYIYAFYVIAIVFYFSLPVFVDNYSLPDSYVCVMYFVLFSLIYHAIGLIVPQHQYLWTIVFATYGSDTGAWFIGRKYGKHKMNPRVSPKKSWEGFVGGIVFGFVLSLLVSFAYVSSLSFGLNFLLCLLCPAAAELGDLSFSVIKRHNHVKDFSNLLPGHGGVLDRVDSLMMNILLFGILATLIL